jgi:hypothetical protein
MNRNETKEAFLKFMGENGYCPSYKTIGTDYENGQAALKELEAEGKVKWKKTPSQSGKRMIWKLNLC